MRDLCVQVGGTCSQGDPGTYICACKDGYTAPATGGTCTDVNECDDTPCGVPPQLNRDA